MKLRLIVNPNPGPKKETIRADYGIPLPNIPSLSDPNTDLNASLKAVDDLRLFLDTFFQVDKILEPLRLTRQHPIEAVYLIRFGHELRELRASWLGLLDGVEDTLKTERKARNE